jgi:hypothetical protein
MTMTNPISTRLPIAVVLVLGGLLFAAAPAYAQAATTSSFTIPVSGTASSVKTGLSETVAFSGSVVVIATVVTDPALGPTVALFVDGRGVTGTGAKTKTTYVNNCVANLTRLFGATDVIQTTFAFFQNTAGGYMSAKTGLLTLNLTYNTTTQALTNVTASVGTM